ncbi:MAG: hypothetical protein ACRDV3_00670 [Acidothermaceae bacterium]
MSTQGPDPRPASSPTSESAYLQCESCAAFAVHTVSYAGRLLVSTRCTSCDAVVSGDAGEARARYMRDLEHRLQSKPRRMLRRAVDDPKGFVATLPAKAAAQPGKLAREWRTLFSATRARGSGPTPPTD